MDLATLQDAARALLNNPNATLQDMAQAIVDGALGGGTGSGAIISVNGKRGEVVLTGADINATINTPTPTGAEATTKTITQHLQTLNDYNMTLQGEIDTNAGKTAELDADVQGKVDKAQGAGNAGKPLVVGSDGNVTLSNQIKVNSTSIAISNIAQPETNGHVVIGNHAGGAGNAGVDSVAVGDKATAANYGVALGGDAHAQAESSIQLGDGTNTEPGTLAVATGSYPNQKNVTLLNNQGFIPAAALATAGTTGQVLSKTDNGMEWVSIPSTASISAGDEGLRGDYCSTYGVVGVDYGIITRGTETNSLNIPGGMRLSIPAADGSGDSTEYTMGSPYTYSMSSTKTCFLIWQDFDPDEPLQECDQICFRKSLPEESNAACRLWWDGKVWRFRSINYGDVWRECRAQPLVKCIFNADGTLVRLDYIGWYNLPPKAPEQTA